MESQTWRAVAAAGAFAIAASMPAFAQDSSGLTSFGGFMAKVDRVIRGGTVVIPESSIEKPPGRAHTHLEIVIPNTPLSPPFDCDFSSTCETPASLACVYELVPRSNGCDPDIVTKVASGGSQAIAIVDAYDDKTALSDLKKFSSTFGLPAPDLNVVYCNATSCTNVTSPPPGCKNGDNACGWAGEESLDMQAAHAMAPKAKIYLVEAFSDSNADLLLAEVKAAQLVAAAGGGEVTNSWGGQDHPGESSNDGDFVHTGVVFFASTGDHKNDSDPPYKPDIEYPSTSVDVVGVGGTLINRNDNFEFTFESPWADGGGGLSTGESRPSYQDGVENKVGGHRGVPDIAADASPSSGLLVYCSASACDLPDGSGFYIVGGTSLASPLVAAMTNAAGQFRTSTTAEHDEIYNNLGSSKYNAVTHGQCHNGPGAAVVDAGPGWDVCTGVGTPHGLSGL